MWMQRVSAACLAMQAWPDVDERSFDASRLPIRCGRNLTCSCIVIMRMS